MNDSEHIAHTLDNVQTYLQSLSDSESQNDKKRLNLLCYWMDDYIKLIKQEQMFESKRIGKIKKGQILKVNLGFNIGGEEGGLHYAVAMDNKNSIHSNTVTVIPLTSMKEGKKYSHAGQLVLGNEIHEKLQDKLASQKENRDAYVSKLLQTEELFSPSSSLPTEERVIRINQHMQQIEKQIKIIDKVEQEVSRMKTGSVALINQITTISKQRIYDPTNKDSVLSGIRISNELLSQIEAKINELFLYPGIQSKK